MAENKWIGKKVTRYDGREKATGALKFMADLEFPSTLEGKILRSPYAHALVKGVEITEAEGMSGVVAVLTAKDIPGLNGFGIEGPDQPVLCGERVRFIGDPVAVVFAEDLETAEKAVKKIKVDYEILPAILTPEAALEEGAIKIHGEGNILRHHKSSNGDVEAAFKEAAVVVENTYTTPYEEHAYIETEGGFGLPLEDGGVELYYPAQYCFRDRMQLSAVLALPQEKIRLNSNPLGGAFGGKDDMLLQPILALGAIKTQRPVKIHLSREESFVASTKRLPFKLTMKTAADKNGKFLAHKVYGISEAGPFAGISGAVFNYAFENAFCVYKFPNTDLEGYCVFTNNSVTGAFRGFGNNQMTYGTESQVDQIAEALAMDPIKIRRLNCVKGGERHTHGHIVNDSVIGIDKCLKTMENSDMWKQREAFKSQPVDPWIKRGVGIAVSQHGSGLGNLLDDTATAQIEVLSSGIINVKVSTEEMGQGSLTTFWLIAAESLGVAPEMIEISTGQTHNAPDSGPSTASRSTFIAGNAIIKTAEALKDELKELGKELWGTDEININSQGIYCVTCKTNFISWTEISAALGKKGIDSVTRTVAMPETDIKIDLGLHFIHTYVSQIVDLEVNTLTGEVTLIQTEIFPEAGRVINRLGYEGQSEGGSVMSMGFTIMENFKIKDGKAMTRNMQTYLVPTAADIPEIKVTPVEIEEKEGPYGAKGLGEPASIPITPAITNAIYDAVGIRIKDLPANPERVLMELCAK